MTPRQLIGVWRGWREDPLDRFGVVLFFVAMTIVVSSMVDVGTSYRASLAAHTMSGAALVATARATGLRTSWRRVLYATVAVALAALVVLELAVASGVGAAVPPSSTSEPFWLVLVLVVPLLVIRRLRQHRVVNGRTLLGAVTAYLQIGVAYAAVFQAVDAWSSTYAFGGPQTSSAYTYVSLTTMSTLGIGDIVPTTQLSRLLVASEAVIGQIFLVTVVAIVVSRFARTGRRDGDDTAGG